MSRRQLDADHGPPAPYGRLNAAQIVHARLRAQIVSMQRKPGESIDEKEIAKANGVSRTPVREALLRLAEEGLVEIVAKTGTAVALIPAAELPEAILARRALEQVAVRAAAEFAQNSDVLRLRAIVERQRERMTAHDVNGFHEEDEALHQAITEVAGYPGIWRIIRQLKVQVDRYRRLTLPQSHRMDRALSEHAEIVSAIAERNPDRADAAMVKHMDWLGASLAEIRELNPGYFSGDPWSAHSRWTRMFSQEKDASPRAFAPPPNL
jgi:DNA-binding GntR family transcriptional regulator